LRVLVVEDEKSLAGLIKSGLEEEKYSVDVAYDGEEGLLLAEHEGYDLIILDIMLPGIDGVELMKRLRKSGRDTPVLMLTARSSTEDKVEALNAGADDYLTKPFSFDELLARIKAILRRNHRVATNTIQIDTLTIDMHTHEVRRGEKRIELTAKEYSLLECLALNRNKVLSRDQIVRHIYSFDSELDSNVVDVMITRLRKKIDKDFEKKLIHTVRGVGYMLKG